MPNRKSDSSKCENWWIKKMLVSVLTVYEQSWSTPKEEQGKICIKTGLLATIGRECRIYLRPRNRSTRCCACQCHATLSTNSFWCNAAWMYSGPQPLKLFRKQKHLSHAMPPPLAGRSERKKCQIHSKAEKPRNCCQTVVNARHGTSIFMRSLTLS